MNFSKFKILLICFLFLSLISCSSDDEFSDGSSTFPIKHLKSLAFYINDNHKEQGYFYEFENSKMIGFAFKHFQVTTANMSMGFFESNNQNKITNIQYYTGLYHFTDDPINYVQIPDYPNTINYDFIYTNNRISSIVSDEGSMAFTYSNNLITKIDCIGYYFSCTEVEIIYEGSNFINEIIINNGVEYVFTYEFDENPNPYYVLYEKYGFIQNSYLENQFNINNAFYFKNNIKKIYMDGNLIISWKYEYDSDGYPIRADIEQYTPYNLQDAFIIFEYHNY